MLCTPKLAVRPNLSKGDNISRTLYLTYAIDLCDAYQHTVCRCTYAVRTPLQQPHDAPMLAVRPEVSRAAISGVAAGIGSDTCARTVHQHCAARCSYSSITEQQAAEQRSTVRCVAAAWNWKEEQQPQGWRCCGDQERHLRKGCTERWAAAKSSSVQCVAEAWVQKPSGPTTKGLAL